MLNIKNLQLPKPKKVAPQEAETSKVTKKEEAPPVEPTPAEKKEALAKTATPDISIAAEAEAEAPQEEVKEEAPAAEVKPQGEEKKTAPKAENTEQKDQKAPKKAKNEAKEQKVTKEEKKTEVIKDLSQLQNVRVEGALTGMALLKHINRIAPQRRFVGMITRTQYTSRKGSDRTWPKAWKITFWEDGKELIVDLFRDTVPGYLYLKNGSIVEFELSHGLRACNIEPIAIENTATDIEEQLNADLKEYRMTNVSIEKILESASKLITDIREKVDVNTLIEMVEMDMDGSFMGRTEHGYVVRLNGTDTNDAAETADDNTAS